jgi:serine/threonine protein kinase
MDSIKYEFMINEYAESVDELFLNDDITLIELFPNIYEIADKGMILKIYKNQTCFTRERNNLLKLRDVEGVSKIISYSDDRNCNIKYVILKKESGIDFIEYLQCNDPFTEDEMKKICKSLLQTLNNIHKKNIIHYDIKAENILYNKDTGTTVIIDFEQKYTKEYRSPEYINKKNVSYKTDLWSMGVLFYLLSVDQFPFENCREIQEKRVSFPKNFSKGYRHFLSCLLERDPELRYDCEDALADEWLNS